MRKKKTSVANSQINTDDTKEKRRKFGHKPLDFHEECENYVEFCQKMSYEWIYGEAQSFNEFKSSSKIFS